MRTDCDDLAAVIHWRQLRAQWVEIVNLRSGVNSVKLEDSKSNSVLCSSIGLGLEQKREPLRKCSSNTFILHIDESQNRKCRSCRRCLFPDNCAVDWIIPTANHVPLNVCEEGQERCTGRTSLPRDFTLVCATTTHTRTHTYTHTLQTPTHTHAHTHTYAHTLTHTNTHSKHLHTLMHTLTYTHSKHLHTLMHTHTPNTYTLTHTHTHAKHPHTLTHTHTPNSYTHMPNTYTHTLTHTHQTPTHTHRTPTHSHTSIHTHMHTHTYTHPYTMYANSHFNWRRLPVQTIRLEWFQWGHGWLVCNLG